MVIQFTMITSSNQTFGASWWLNSNDRWWTCGGRWPSAADSPSNCAMKSEMIRTARASTGTMNRLKVFLSNQAGPNSTQFLSFLASRSISRLVCGWWWTFSFESKMHHFHKLIVSTTIPLCFDRPPSATQRLFEQLLCHTSLVQPFSSNENYLEHLPASRNAFFVQSLFFSAKRHSYTLRVNLKERERERAAVRWLTFDFEYVYMNWRRTKIGTPAILGSGYGHAPSKTEQTSRGIASFIFSILPNHFGGDVRGRVRSLERAATQSRVMADVAVSSPNEMCLSKAHKKKTRWIVRQIVCSDRCLWRWQWLSICCCFVAVLQCCGVVGLQSTTAVVVWSTAATLRFVWAKQTTPGDQRARGLSNSWSKQRCKMSNNGQNQDAHASPIHHSISPRVLASKHLCFSLYDTCGDSFGLLQVRFLVVRFQAECAGCRRHMPSTRWRDKANIRSATQSVERTTSDENER